ncbi:hypothetical protein ABV409_16605, partial [Flagellimonas sp. DF-77]|uniref:beta strand repeat-containing protein n=1 Tax=Flagellimonas algarum TaxID=3230298 RepID=UPI00339AE2D5
MRKLKHDETMISKKFTAKHWLVAVLFFMATATAVSQTTVTLQDQCNCEVLSGTDVSAAGATTPTGADVGDLYVNTTSGTIFFWDGDSWELTSSDSNTTNISLTEDGTDLILTDSDGNTVTIPLADIQAADTNTTNISLTEDGTDLILTDSDGNTVSIPLADIQAANTDDQTLATDGTAGNISIEDGNTITLNVDDADADPTNEITDVTDNGDGTTTITDVNGGTVTVDNDGVDNVDDADNDPTNEIQDAAGVAITDAGGNFTGTDVEAALAELAAGSTDDQTVSTDGTAGNLSIEDGNTITLNVDDADADPTNEITDVTDNGDGTTTITDVNGGTVTVDNDGVDNVDDADNDPTNEIQDAAGVAITDAGGNFTGNDVEAALAELATGSTDDQTLSTDGTAGNISIEDGNAISLNVDDADADPTNEIQDADEVAITDAGGNFTGTDVEAALAELAAGSTDDQTVSTDGTAGNISIEDGNAITLNVDDADADATNEIQDISTDGTAGDISLSSGSNLTLNVDDADADATNEIQDADEVAITDAGGNFTGTDVEAALAELAAGSTDDQTVSTDGTAGNISIEDGNAITLNVDDADADATNEYNTGVAITAGSLGVTDGGGTQSANLISADANNDLTAGTDGALYLNVASVSIAETNTSLSFNDTNNQLTYTNELGNNPVVDLSALDDSGTDDQTLATDGTAGNISIEDGNAI